MKKRTYTPVHELSRVLHRAQELQRRYMKWYVVNTNLLTRILGAVIAVGNPKAYAEAREAGVIV